MEEFHVKQVRPACPCLGERFVALTRALETERVPLAAVNQPAANENKPSL